MPFDDERLVELVNLTADGQSTPQQQAELQELLDHSPEARQFEASTRELVTRLDSLEKADPPPGLRPAVLSEVAAPAKISASPRSMTRRRRFTLAWAAAATVVVGFLIVNRDARVAGDHVGAVMAPAASWPVVASLTSDHDTLDIHQSEDLYTLVPRISGPYPVTVTLSWAPEAAVLVAHSGGPDVISSAHKTEFTVRSAEERVSVMVRRLGEDPFDVHLAVAGNEIIRTEVPSGVSNQLF